ncbi:MAG: hypothetical protein K9M57_07980 [Phycisphaerae bacterium]|nr:hypothetical protein [Phycisphaerae bacterium]
MKIKLLISLIAGILIGILGHSIWLAQTSTARHWRAVKEYNTYWDDTSNWEQGQSGLLSASEPSDIMPHLAALVSEEELIYQDIVLPTVPCSNRHANRYWMAYCQRHSDKIVHVSGTYDPDGPLHLNIWYTPTGEILVEQLIDELKEMGTNNAPVTSSVPATDVTKSMVGRWGIDGEISLIISLQDDRIIISAPKNEMWQIITQDASIIKDSIHFIQKHYIKNGDEHPFNGVECDSIIKLIDKNKLEHTMTTEQLPNGKSSILTRIE